MTRSFYRSFFTLALLAVLSTGQVHAQTGTDLLQRLQQTYTPSKSMRAEFTQTMSGPYGDETFTGTLVVAGTRYRVEAGPQQFVTDGVTTWLYNATQKQVIVSDFVEDETTFSPTSFLTRYGSRYRVTGVTNATVGGAKHYTLTLVPKSDSEFFEEVKVTMRDRDNVITRIALRDVNSTTMRYDLRNIQFDPAVTASTFRFTAPKGTEVIDMREQG